MKFSTTGQETSPFNTGDCLIEMTTWVGLTALYLLGNTFVFICKNSIITPEKFQVTRVNTTLYR